MDILDIFWTFYLNPLSPLWGYFLNSGKTSLRGILIAVPLPLVWGVVSVADVLAVVSVADVLAVVSVADVIVVAVLLAVDSNTKYLNYVTL